MCEPSKVLLSLIELKKNPWLLPVYQVCNVTRLSRARVGYLIATGVFQVRRLYGSDLVEMKSVESWYSQRVARENKRLLAGKAQKLPRRKMSAKGKVFGNRDSSVHS